MSTDEKGFVIKDNPSVSEGNAEANKSTAAAGKKTGTKNDSEEKVCHDISMPEITFATFIFSLNSSALVNLGLVEDPGTGKKTKDLLLAKQTIDILGMLEKKTKGNLANDEEQLLKNILHDLRIMYVKVC